MGRAQLILPDRNDFVFTSPLFDDLQIQWFGVDDGAVGRQEVKASRVCRDLCTVAKVTVIDDVDGEDRYVHRYLAAIHVYLKNIPH